MKDQSLIKFWDLLRMFEDPGIIHTDVQNYTENIAVLHIQIFQTWYPHPWFNNYVSSVNDLLLKIMLNVLVLEGQITDYR